ncbi:MAG: hypothetical protein IPJ65_28055 [Archangiaceae bacterium]|nr:hypothetical protein [Archangiaceae bacterium]
MRARQSHALPQRIAAAALVLLTTTGCTGMWVRIASNTAAASQLQVQTFHGRTVEQHMLPQRPDGELVKDVWYQKLSKVRVEVVAPEDLKGNLFVTDGEQVAMWWPAWRFGLRVRGLPHLDEHEQYSALSNRGVETWKTYELTQHGAETVAGRPVDRWAGAPRKAGRARPYQAWMDQRYALPLKLEVNDGWYAMQYEAVEYDVPAPPSAFAFEFPRDALVLEWDLKSEGLSTEAAQAELDFPLLAPPALHVEKVLIDRRQAPVALVVMNEGARWLTLTESKRGVKWAPPTGKRVELGASEGWLDFFGTYSALSWSHGDTQLTLISNLPYDEALALAEGIGRTDG